jgi:hypothetical protein
MERTSVRAGAATNDARAIQAARCVRIFRTTSSRQRGRPEKELGAPTWPVQAVMQGMCHHLACWLISVITRGPAGTVYWRTATGSIGGADERMAAELPVQQTRREVQGTNQDPRK